MNKIRPTELLTQSSILGDFLSDPIKNVPERSPQQKPAKSRVEVKKVSNKAKEKLRSEPKKALKKKKPMLVAVSESKKRVTYYMTRKQIRTLLRLIFEINSEKGIETDKSRLVRAAIDLMARQNLETVVKHLKNA